MQADARARADKIINDAVVLWRSGRDSDRAVARAAAEIAAVILVKAGADPRPNPFDDGGVYRCLDLSACYERGIRCRRPMAQDG
jgi:hypothetical protein